MITTGVRVKSLVSTGCYYPAGPSTPKHRLCCTRPTDLPYPSFALPWWHADSFRRILRLVMHARVEGMRCRSGWMERLCRVVYGECCDGDAHIREGCLKWHANQHSHPIKGSDPLANAMFEEWQATAAHLSSGISPRRLELSLVCEFGQEAVDAAKLAITSLLLLPELKDCHERLCRSRGSELDQIISPRCSAACLQSAATKVAFAFLTFKLSPRHPPTQTSLARPRVYRPYHTFQGSDVE
jgi:hypothetical protein